MSNNEKTIQLNFTKSSVYAFSDFQIKMCLYARVACVYLLRKYDARLSQLLH